MCDTKKCSKCGGVKGLGEFYAAKTGRLGRSADCKQCRRAAVNAYRTANEDVVKQRKRNAYKANPQPYIERARSAYWRDPAASIAAVSEWRRENPEKQKALNQKLKKMPSGIAARLRYREKYRERINESAAARGRAYAEALDDRYVRGVLSSKSDLLHKDIPDALVALKREQLAIKRMARELKKAATKPTGENE